MQEETLKQKTAKGLLWGGMNNGIMQILNLVFGIVLGRLLAPSDYGMIGALLIFSYIAGAIQESGFTSALINRKEIRHEDYNAVFWFSASMGAFFYIILFFCAPLIAQFYHEPEIVPLSRYMFLGFFVSSLYIPHNALLTKQLKVRQKSVTSLTSLLVSGTVGIVMAYNGYAYWGLATQSITYVTCIAIGQWYFSGWRPSLPIDFRPLREMFGFSVKMLMSNLITQINNNFLTVILGRFYSVREVGFYNQANKWNGMGFSVIQGMINGVAQPVMREVVDDRDRLERVFRKMLRFAAFVSMPCMFGLSLVAPEIITMAITEKWSESVWMLQIACIGGAFMPIQNLMYNLILSKGRSDICLWNTVVYGLVQIAVVLLCIHEGLLVVIWAFVLVNILWVAVWGFYVWRLTGVSGWMMLKDILPFSVIAACCMLVAYWSAHTISSLYLSLAVKVVVASACYILVMHLSGAKVFKECVQQVREILYQRISKS